MSHAEQIGFFEAVAEVNEELLKSASVLEIGSYDVNGTVRRIFGQARRYVGVDLSEGPGVDVVGFGHELAEPDGSFDLAVSSECFEHDEYWPQTLATMARLTRAGGLVAFTCASRGRFEHGTQRTGAESSPGTQAQGLDHYRNLTTGDFRGLPLCDWFDAHQFWYLPWHSDLYFAGIRSGAAPNDRPRGELPDSRRVESLNQLTPLTRRLALLPLRSLARVLPDARYQSIVWPVRSLARRAGHSPIRSTAHH